MDSILIPWNDGNGNIVINKNEDNTILISSDSINNSLKREQTLVFSTTKGQAVAFLKVIQGGNRVILRDSNNIILRDKNYKILTATT